MKICLLEPLAVEPAVIERFAEELQALGHSLTAFDSVAQTDDEIVARAGDCDILMIANHKVSNEAIDRMPNLKLIAVAFTGFDHVGLEACRRRGIQICNCAGYSDQAVAELVIGMAIQLLRRVKDGDAAVRSGGNAQGLMGREIAGKTVGIIGLGKIGLKTARMFEAFGARVIYANRSEKPESGLQRVSLAELMAESDIVSLHLPLNAETRGTLGHEEFAAMKPSAVFINCARGPIVDNRALADHLRKGTLAGAAIDVFDTEPPLPADDALLSAPNTLLTPHVAYLTQESMLRRAAIEFENVRAYLAGKPQNLVSF